MAELKSSTKTPPEFTVVLPQMYNEKNHTSSFSGAPTYMSPEGFQSQEITILSDLWSLGCVLYEMFTG